MNAMIIDLEEIFFVGKDSYFSSISPANTYGVTFEDNLTTGYFYAVETKPDLFVLDGLHIYNVDDVSQKDQSRKIQIIWTEDGLIASLLLNDYCHAVFDFKEKAGFCRNGFPENKSGWVQNSDRILTDELIEKIFNSFTL